MRKPTEEEKNAAYDRIAARYADDDARRLAELLTREDDAALIPALGTLTPEALERLTAPLSPEDVERLTRPLSPEEIETLTAPPNLALFTAPPEFPDFFDDPNTGRDDE